MVNKIQHGHRNTVVAGGREIPKSFFLNTNWQHKYNMATQILDGEIKW